MTSLELRNGAETDMAGREITTERERAIAIIGSEESIDPNEVEVDIEAVEGPTMVTVAYTATLLPFPMATT